MNFIKMEKVSKTYGKVTKALNSVNVEIAKGEFVVMLGPSGAGKSTFLNILGGLESADEGLITIGDYRISDFTRKEMEKYRRENLSYIFQFYNLIETLTVLENVKLIEKEFDSEISSEEILDSLGLGEHLHKFPSELSGGQQQRVSIARALVKNSNVILCDEPTGALDSKSAVMVMDILKQASADKKKTVIVVTHNDDFKKMADKTIYFKDGEILKVEMMHQKERSE